ncbi:MAG: transketolase [Gammaproteobacteria bacterium]
MPISESEQAAAARPPRIELANAIRTLAMDAVQRANSGHPGMPMGMADIAEVLWNDYLRHNPTNPRWPNRDRFVLSNGHGSMLLYAVTHLCGYPLSIEEIKDFRQLGSRTAGHPEYELDIGIETTTGPLGQGLANGVGMALAERLLGAQFNRPNFDVVDHHTYVFLGDGCLMEGISHEACSLAGTLGLGKLICLYDDNGISIDGEVDSWFSDDTPARFRAYGWHVVEAVDGHDPAAISAAITAAKANPQQPSLICCKTIIGFGATNKQGTAATHGAPLGEDEIAVARQALQWPHEPFEIPQAIRAAWDATEIGRAHEAQWQTLFEDYRAEFPEQAEEFERRVNGKLPVDFDRLASDAIAQIAGEAKDMATRKASERALDAFGAWLPELIGGSADLTGSNNTFHAGSSPVAGDGGGNYIYYGVREFGMAAIMNGLALHGGFIPYGGTFLTFADYARNALRMAALVGQGSIFVFTHDSIGLGEDGPTHQPVEHLASLRLMPNMRVWRPCDAVETAAAWRDSIERRSGPTSLILTRQGLPHQVRTTDQLAAIGRGGYILFSTPAATPAIIIIATGSEVTLAMTAAQQLAGEGVEVRVVSMPCVELFDAQPADYRAHVLPAKVAARVVVEAGSTGLWWRYVGTAGAVVGIDEFGASAPAKQLFEKFGITSEAVTEAARRLL